MKQDKEILFSDYLREDPFLKDNEPAEQFSEETSSNSDHTPEWTEPEGKVSDVELKDFWKSIRHFFKTGEKPAGPEKQRHYPVLIAPYLKGQLQKTDFPFYLTDGETGRIVSLKELLENTFNKLFTGNEAVILKANLSRLVAYFNAECVGGKGTYSFYPMADLAFSKLKTLDVRGNEGKLFREHVTKLLEAMPETGKLMPFSDFVPFLLLDNQLRLMAEKREVFLNGLKKLISKLNARLKVENDKIGKTGNRNAKEQDFDFAGSMISFETMEEMMPDNASESMSEKRFKRIQSVIEELSNADLVFSSHRAKIITRPEWSNTFLHERLFDKADLHLVSDGVCDTVLSIFNQEMKAFMNLIVSFQIAELELKDRYDEDIHSTHFSFFNQNNLSEYERSLFPPVFVIEDAETLLKKELEGFSKLLAFNIPVKILAINHDLGFKVTQGDESYVFRQELAALTIAHRGAYLFQGSSDEPIMLNKCFYDGLLSPAPAIWHLLLPEPKGSSQDLNYLKITTAIESRFFPRIIYNHHLGRQLGSRFDILCNPQAAQKMSHYEIEVKRGKEKETVRLSFSLVDYLIQDSVIANQLLVIPPAFWTDDLIPLSDYFEKTETQLMRKVPFVWVVNEENKLQKAAVPFAWVTKCSERLDFWQFVQELGGVNSFHIDQSTQSLRKQWNEEKEREIKELKEEFDLEAEKIRNEAAGKAMDKLVAVLLDLDGLTINPTFKKPTLETALIQSSETIKEKAPAVKKVEPMVSADPWVETYRCTTCNDCIDKLPGVFKYNADKQAYIEDASRATFSQMVAIAENCPAKCIHPGQPQNLNESGLDELLERAAKLN